MNSELLILKDIYFLLTIITVTFLIIMMFKLIITLSSAKKALASLLSNKEEWILSTLFEKDKIEELINNCETKLREKPNSKLPLWYLAKAYFLRGEHMRARDYLDRLKKVDPSSENSYAKGHWEKTTQSFRQE